MNCLLFLKQNTPWLVSEGGLPKVVQQRSPPCKVLNSFHPSLYKITICTFTPFVTSFIILLKNVGILICKSQKQKATLSTFNSQQYITSVRNCCNSQKAHKRLKKKTYRGGVSKGGTRREENVYNEPNCILTVSLLLQNYTPVLQGRFLRYIF